MPAAGGRPRVRPDGAVLRGRRLGHRPGDAFLKSLQSAVSLGNRLKVATLVHFPLTVWVDGEETVIHNESEFQARYGRIFDASVKKSIAAAKVETLVATQEGVMFDNGRIRVRPLAEHKNALKIVAINDPNQAR